MFSISSIKDTVQFKISAQLLMATALKKGYELTFFPSSPSTQSGLVRGVKDGREIFFKSTCTALTSAFGVFAAENKMLTHSLLQGNGVPTPETVAVQPGGSITRAKEMLSTYGRVVVKPTDANHGDGVTVDVTNLSMLKKATAFAFKFTGPEGDVLVQRQVEGKEYRFLVVSGRVVAVAHRRPPFVVGDGSATIEQLIDQKNADPRRGRGHQSPLTTINIEDIIHYRGRAFLKTVPKKDQLIEVLGTSNLSRGGESVDFTDSVSYDLKKMAVAAAQGCFQGIAGVDIISPDVTANTVEGSYVIEVNLTPGLRMHQFPTTGKPRNVAKAVFAAIEKTSRPINKPLKHVGRAEKIKLPDLTSFVVPVRIDTGATLSSLWVSDVAETVNGLTFVVFGPKSKYYTGKPIIVKNYSKRPVTNSTGHIQIRYVIQTKIVLKGRKINASITLADRSTQVYPILIGRNVLKNKFIVDVATGKAQVSDELRKRAELDNLAIEGKISR